MLLDIQDKTVFGLWLLWIELTIHFTGRKTDFKHRLWNHYLVKIHIKITTRKNSNFHLSNIPSFLYCYHTNVRPPHLLLLLQEQQPRWRPDSQHVLKRIYMCAKKIRWRTCSKFYFTNRIRKKILLNDCDNQRLWVRVRERVRVRVR